MIPSPNTGTRLRAVKRPAYQPVLSAIERAAYAAAHRIVCEQTVPPQLACAGARRSAQADAIARIIVDSMSQGEL